MKHARYGKSMYGGWYAEVFETGEWFNFETVNEMRNWAVQYTVILSERFDNI